MRRTNDLGITGRVGSKPCQGQNVVSASKNNNTKTKQQQAKQKKKHKQTKKNISNFFQLIIQK
jgi:hypothetical protein